MALLVGLTTRRLKFNPQSGLQWPEKCRFIKIEVTFEDIAILLH